MPFSPDYFTARSRFQAAAVRLGWRTQGFPIEARGPADELLTIDVATSRGPADWPLLMVVSGVHGVEGFFGSAVQLAVMDNWARTGSPVGVRCVFVHAVCPYGFAHVRRFDENNVDLNRNFLLEGESYRGCPPMYASLDPVLNPRRPPTRWEFFALRTAWNTLRYGYTNLKQAVAGGQYEYPQGMFFGGQGSAQANQILTEQFAGWLADSRVGLLLDFHTGLGPWGTYKLLIDAPLSAEQYERTAQWFGPSTLERTHAAGTAYQTRGGFDPWCATQARGRDFVALCAEFGTFDTVRVLAAVRAENMAHHWGSGRADPRNRQAKAELQEMFCPASPRWREDVLQGSCGLILRAITGLKTV